MAIRFRSATSLAHVVAGLAIFGLPTLGYSSTPGAEAILSRSFTTVQLSEIQTTTTPTNKVTRRASMAVFGPVEKIDVIGNSIVVAGQFVDTTGLMIDDFELGDLVSLGGLVSTSGVSEATIELLPNAYVYGATLAYVEGFVAKSNPSTASATIGGITVDYSMALSKSIGAAAEFSENVYVRVVGIQVSSGKIIAADLQIVPPNPDDDSTNGTPAESAKATDGGDRSASVVLSGDRSAKAILGGDLSTKAILGRDRSAKAIIGGDRSAKAMLGRDRSAKAIIGGDRSTKAILGGDLSAKAIIGGDRSTKAIFGGDRFAKAIIGGDRSTKAILGGDRFAKAIIGGDRSSKAILGEHRSKKVIIGRGLAAKVTVGRDRSTKDAISGERSRN